MKNKKYREVLSWASSFLKKAQVEEAGAKYLLLGRLKWTETDWVLNHHKEMSPPEQKQYLEDLHRFSKGEPAQYILGEVDFYGQSFKVNSATLIPRPETEELVDLCLRKNPKEKNLKVLDIGTGSGAIALSLKNARPDWQVFASDISSQALAVARENSRRQELSVDFVLGDLLKPFADQKFDIIISNPPYISSREIKEMDKSVLEHEPKEALFAKNKGYAIYQQLAHQLPHSLKQEGQVYLEFGYKQGKTLKRLFKEAFPAKEVTLYQDLQGKDRMLTIC